MSESRALRVPIYKLFRNHQIHFGVSDTLSYKLHHPILPLKWDAEIPQSWTYYFICVTRLLSVRKVIVIDIVTTQHIALYIILYLR